MEPLAIGLEQMQRNFKPMADQINNWHAAQITDRDAKEVIYRTFIEDQVDAPEHLARIVHREYFEPALHDLAPRTKWSLQNAFTSSFKLLEPIPLFKSAASLGEFFSTIQ